MMVSIYNSDIEGMEYYYGRKPSLINIHFAKWLRAMIKRYKRVEFSQTEHKWGIN